MKATPTMITEQDLNTFGFIFNTNTQSYMHRIIDGVSLEVRLLSTAIFKGAKCYLRRGCHNETTSCFDVIELQAYLTKNGLV